MNDVQDKLIEEIADYRTTTKPGQHRGGTKHLEELVEIGTTIDISEQGASWRGGRSWGSDRDTWCEDYVQLPEAPQEGSVHLSK